MLRRGVGGERLTLERGTAIANPLSWWIASLGMAILALLLSWAAPAFLESARHVYENDPWRLRFALLRIDRYPTFFYALSGLSLAVGLALRFGALSSGIAYVLAGRFRYFLAGAATVFLLARAFSVSTREWIRFGRPCWDGYCDAGTAFAAFLGNASAETWRLLTDFLDSYLHANSPLGPVVFGALSLALPDVVISYRLTAAFATIGTLVVLLRFSREHLGLSLGGSVTAAFLFLASGHVQRGIFFPQTDPMAMFFLALTIDRALVFRKKAGVSNFILLVGSGTLALFTKLSALPALAMAGLIVVWPLGPDEATRTPPLMKRLCIAVLVCVIPTGLLAGYAAFFHTFDNYVAELAARVTVDSRATLHLGAAVTALFPLVIALWMSRRRVFASVETMLLLCVVVYLAGLWAGGASGWDRFYLNVLPLALPLAVKRFACFEELRRPATAFLLGLWYFLAHALRMELGLYY